MKILQLCTKVPYPPKDGGSAAVFALSDGFAKNGHEVTIFAINPPKHYTETSVHTPENISILPVNIDTVPNFSDAFANLVLTRLPYHTTRFAQKKVKQRLIDILKTQRFDIIQLEGTYLGGLLPVIRKYSKAKVGLRAHNIEHKLWDDITNSATNIFKKVYLKLQSNRLKHFELDLIRKVDFLIPISEIDKQELNKLSPVKSIVIPYGVSSLPINTPSLGNTKKDICYIGALDWIPNQEGIVWFVEKVCPRLFINMPDLKINIAGRNAPEFLKALFMKIPNIVFHGEVDNAIAFMQSYKAMVVPLFTGGGMRVKIIDALSLKLPVISSPKAIEGTALLHQQHVLIATNEIQFTKAISDILSSNNLANRLSEEGYQYICKNYNNLYWATQLVNFFES